jgi:hypothetical protein
MARSLRASRFLYRAGLLLALSAAGCAEIKPYPNSRERNAVLHVRTDFGTLLSRIGADVDLYAVDAACNADYLGSLKLHDSSVNVGLPLEKRIRLAYAFSRSSILGRRAKTVIEMTLTPHKGYRYEFNVSYLKNGYSATGLEFAPGQVHGREIEYVSLRDCIPAS